MAKYKYDNFQIVKYKYNSDTHAPIMLLTN